MLAWPALALIKNHLPDDELHVLVPEYTREIAGVCPSVDRVIVDPGSRSGVVALRSLLRAHRYRALVTLFSTTRVGLAGWLARIPERVAPATKVAQIFYNHRIVQRRSRSLKPEHEYNVDLARFALEKLGVWAGAVKGPPYLEFDAHTMSEFRREFVSTLGTQEDRRLVFIHPGSGGSAGNLELAQFARLGRGLNSDRGHCIVVTAGPGELGQARRLSRELNGIDHAIYESTRGLVGFARHIALADVFISGSTGPLHIAGALNRPTVGFYTRRISATSVRWQTLSQAQRRLAFSPPPAAEEEDMSAIDVEAAACEISNTFLNAHSRTVISAVK
jgi:ADP-heptose:LPS heptosyltransferase